MSIAHDEKKQAILEGGSEATARARRSGNGQVYENHKQTAYIATYVMNAKALSTV